MAFTTLQRWGNSQGIRIPKFILDEANINLNEEVKLYVSNGSIVIQKCNNHKTIKDLFESYDGDYTPTEFDWGEPVGGEVW